MPSPPLPKIKGFDRQGEPELRASENGGLELVFNFMPPMTAAGEERAPDLFEDFEKALSSHLRVTVIRDDRKTFIIAKPSEDTAAQLSDYLSNFWKAHAKPLKAALAAVPRPSNAPFKTETEFYAALSERLAPLVKPMGFKPFKFIGVCFRRKTDAGNDTFTITTKYAAPFFSPQSGLYVTNDIVERIYAMASDMEKRFLKGQWTNAGELDGLPIGTSGEALKRPADLDDWVPRFVEHLNVVAIPQFKKICDLESIERDWNNRSASPPKYLQWPRPDKIAGTGLIVAKLLGRGNLGEIASFHRRHLATLECVNSFPEVEPIVMGSSVDELIARANAWHKNSGP
jgi:hypothetical protein